MPIRLAQGGLTYPLNLTPVGIVVDWRVFSTRPTEACFSAIECDDEDRVDSASTTVAVRLLKKFLSRSFTEIDNSDFEGTGSFALEIFEISVFQIVGPGTPTSRSEEI
jgi:hypothetical protein